VKRTLRLRRLFLVAAACLILVIAWFAFGDLLPPEWRAQQTSDASCDLTLEERATDAWLARTFDLSQVPGDPATPPLERMQADDRGVFVRSYPTGSYREQIEEIRGGALLVAPGKPPQPLDEIDWSVTDLGAYYETKLHGWAGLAQLLDSKERLPRDVEDAVAVVIRDWFRCNAAWPGVSSSAWSEGSIVMRLSVILLAIDYYRAHGGLGDLRFIDLLYLAATNKDQLLVANYPIGNHGLRQDIVLMSYVGNLPYSADAEEVSQLTGRRLAKMARELFSAEGIWKEHAPGYVHYALRHLTDLDRVAKDAALPAELPILENASASAAYLREVLTPDGELPPIGMSADADISRTVAKHWGIDGADGPYVRDRSAIFEDYGQAIYSSSQGGQQYVLFHAAQNLPAGKRHADELSFIVHNHGRWWLVDSGHYTYEETPVHRFLVSARAHNTYSRGDRSVPYDERP
jgi:Heparinase II/III-like protein